MSTVHSACPSCGAEVPAAGTAEGGSITCRACGTAIPPSSEPIASPSSAGRAAPAGSAEGGIARWLLLVGASALGAAILLLVLGVATGKLALPNFGRPPEGAATMRHMSGTVTRKPGLLDRP